MRRGQVGIGVLIVFIATILVAAVAASVYLQTSNRLQSVALGVGSESQDRISKGMDIVEVLAIVDESTYEVYKFEVLIRTLPSSPDILPETLLLRTSARDFAYFAHVQDARGRLLSTTTLDAQTPLFDEFVYAFDERDVRVSVGTGAQVGVAGFADDSVVVVTAQDFGGAVVNVSGVSSFTTVPLRNESTGQLFGFFRNESSSFVFSDATNDCLRDGTIANARFCLEEVTGNGDRFINNGEMWLLHYYLSPSSFLKEGDELEMSLYVGTGLVASVNTRLPFVFSESYAKVWP